MEHISKNNSLETAKNRLDISGLTYVEGTKYVYDRIVSNGLTKKLMKYMPLVESSNGYVLRYKNLMRQYYWLINKFIPSCSYQKLCIRNGEKTWIQYENMCDILRKYYTVSFYDDDNLMATISVANGNTATPFTPSKTGYNFIGWTTENGGEDFFDFNTPITGDTSVYAKYYVKQFEISFILNNGEPDVVITVNYGEMPTIADPEKEGYTFVGWNKEITVATKNTTYKAVYKQDIYIVRFFNINDAEHIIDYYDAQPINRGTTAEYRLVKTETHALHDQSTYYLTRPTYQHFECVEEGGNTWWIDRDGNSISSSVFTDITQDIDVFPKLTKKKYTVTFLDWDNTVISEQIVEYLDDAIVPSEPTRQHYTFTGWDRGYTEIKDNTVIHATYIGEDIEVTYMIPDTGGIFTVFSSVTTTYNSNAPTVDSPKKESYPPEDYGVFDGWYSDTSCTVPFDYTTLLQGNTIIYGKWKTEFEVTFYNWDGTIITGDTQTGFANPVYVRYGEDVTDEELYYIIDNMIDKPGYDFLGWNKSTTGITYDVKITAVFDDTQICLVRFINNADGSVISATTVEYGSTIFVSDYPEPPEVEHMEFTRWDGDTSQVFGDTDVYALYEYSNVTVYFLDYNRNEIGSKIVQYGQTGHTPDYMVEDMDVMGYNGNEEYIKSTIRFDGTYCLMRDEFDPDTGCSTPEETIITDVNCNFIAQYDEIATAVTMCNVNFYNYDSAYWFTDTVLYGTVIDSAYSQNILDIFASEGATPDLSAQTFYGWADEYGNEYVIGKNELSVSSNINLYARYKMISYTVQFFVQSNPEYYPELIDMPIQSLETDILKNNALDRPDCSNIPERVYFETFCDGLNNRWYIDTACTIEWIFKQDVQMQPVANPDLVTEDMILYGKYIGKEYNLTYDTNGGSSITQETYRYPIVTVRPENPSKQDSTFIGWYTDNITFKNKFVFGEPLREDTVIYAKWISEPEENVILYNASADLREYMPDMGDAHLVPGLCEWDMLTFDGVLVYDSPIETFNIGTLNTDSSVTVNTSIKRNLNTITIPSRANEVVVGQFEDCRYLYAIYVSEDYIRFRSIDGVLYRRFGGSLQILCYPQAKTDNSFTFEYVDSVYSHSVIYKNAFANCKNLQTIKLIGHIVRIPGRLEIQDDAFKNCINLREIISINKPEVDSQIYIPLNATEEAFNGVDIQNCKLKVQCEYYDHYYQDPLWGQFDLECFGTLIYLDPQIISVYDDVLTPDIIDEAIEGLTDREEIISVKMGSNVTTITDNTFENCIMLTSVTIGENVTYIGCDAFSHSKLVGVNIPDNVEIIYTSAFNDCSYLTSVTFGGSVTKIGLYSFAACSSLRDLYIPYTIQEIGESAFDACINLQSIICDRITPPTLGERAFDNTNDCPIYVPCDSVNDYKTATNWNRYESRIQCIPQPGTKLHLINDTTVILTEDTLTAELISMRYKQTLVACEIWNNVTTIDDGAFYVCTRLTSVTIPDSVTTIGEIAFSRCANLTSITIPDSVTSIGDNAFAGSMTLSTIIFESEQPPTIGSSVFDDIDENYTIYVPLSSLFIYRTSWPEYASRIMANPN